MIADILTSRGRTRSYRTATRPCTTAALIAASGLSDEEIADRLNPHFLLPIIQVGVVALWRSAVVEPAPLLADLLAAVVARAA